ncbi:2-oxo acid dehydrogenase subunit E2 [Blastopirellula marina]|uniref:Dihydrolipoamide acetyltransferase component of pyruvate dehydrogenase complex n=1 Tax=Blastopirellula marina DSM 3645 TaxID=314230 RepID=A4A156_9BACT|nr:2-oxo acid dehydrogenase subunit E2 [Blastopirellula marina]EAQ77516.1 pyruvate dehydrogenase, E2 component, dihydrolipoamideacetyltransferase [Blastopirellula marina DSM 3645]
MATEVKLPELGDGIDSGDILSVYVSEGDVVTKNQNILELETDKATVEIPTNVAGKVTKVHVKTGDAVPIGGALISVEASEGAAKEESKPAPAPKKEAEAPKAEAKKAEPAPKAEAPKAEPPKPAPAAAKPAPTPEPAVTYAAPVARAATSSADLIYQEEDDVPAGPAIRRFAREVGVDLRRVRGTGNNGRVTRDDVLATVRELSQGGAPTLTAVAPAKADKPTTTPAVTPPGEQGEDAYGPVRIEKMAKIRKTIANQMVMSWTTAPRVTNFDDADVTALEALRQQSKDDYASAGVKLTSMSFLVKAVALALRNNPAINALIDMENNQVVYKEYVNVGIAVDSERGLVVPNIRNADRLAIPEIARDVQKLAADVRGGTFSMDQIRGGTFTISNLGAIGGTYSTPIINVPEVAILLVGRSRKLPVVVNDQIVPRMMMPLSLSYDHRLVDGATAARFLNEIKSYLEAPSRLLLAP